jgi:CheY-like chemotaxis protein
MITSSDILHGKILIVDDQQANIMLLDRMLRGAGYDSIDSTTNPNGVSDLHRKNNYDLIMLDLEMPGDAYSGFQVMEDLKKIETEYFLPVIVITAHPGHKLHALQAGARDFISKPFDLAEVLARVHNMIEVRLLHVAANSRIDALEHQLEEARAGSRVST